MRRAITAAARKLAKAVLRDITASRSTNFFQERESMEYAFHEGSGGRKATVRVAEVTMGLPRERWQYLACVSCADEGGGVSYHAIPHGSESLTAFIEGLALSYAPGYEARAGRPAMAYA